MATDTAESPLSPSQPPSYTAGQPRHFYLAVDRLPFKIETLVDLLGVVGRKSGLPIVVCCSSRDELDTVCSTVSSLPYISLSSLYSDLPESDRAQILESFRRAIIKWNQSAVGSRDEVENGEEGSKSHMVVVTDVCLPIASVESPLPARILINYELPVKKEIYMRRMAACLAPGAFRILRDYHLINHHISSFCTVWADGIVINMVVGGEVVTLKSIEETSNLIIAEMPIQVSDILG